MTLHCACGEIANTVPLPMPGGGFEYLCPGCWYRREHPAARPESLAPPIPPPRKRTAPKQGERLF